LDQDGSSTTVIDMYISAPDSDLRLGQVPNPDNMPTSPLPDKPWCPELATIKSSVCAAYAPTEIAVSTTAAGHLTPDVVLVQPMAMVPGVALACEHLVIRDFGVDWRHVKWAARNEQLFRDSMARFETDKSLTFRILGYSDCVGAERNNFLLRRGRAHNIFLLLGKSARSRVLSTKAAPEGSYLTDNSTIAARARNRAVVIQIFLNSVKSI
jgi:hypothetical protein